MVGDLGLGELEAMGGGDYHGAVVGANDPALAQLHKRREGHASMGAVEHAGEVGPGGSVHELLLRGLLHDAVALLERQDGTINGHRVTDLDGRGKGGGSLHRLKALKRLLVCQVERVGVLGLSHHHAGDTVNKAEVLGHLEALVEGVDVAEVAARDDDPLGHLPVKLLQDLDGRSLLALQPQTVHRIGQVDGSLGRHLADEFHAAVEVGVDGEDAGSVGDGLHQLRQADLVGGEENNGRDVGGGAIG
mmetsp:Transcript_15533/g.43465  ORF Transcript_15533/g.43465 Transcript_15533/m.43465 type:complete len:247 (+) Transcript_15533:180-920(+)